MTVEIPEVTHDEEADAAYVYLTDIDAGGVARSVPVENTPFVLDFDSDGTLLGIEALDPDAIPDELLEQATEL